MKRRPLPVAATLAATAALLLTGCSSGDDSSKDNDKIAGADTGASTKSPSSNTESSTATDRPKIELPSDLTFSFDWPMTGDKDKDAVLADRKQSIQAVNLAIVNQDALDKAYLYYYEGEAAANTEQYIEAFIKAKARTTGAFRYYDAVVNVRDTDSASLVYCEDQGKGYDMSLTTKKVNKTAVTEKSYVLYSLQLRKSEKDVWVVEKLASQRGSAKCQP